MSEFRVPVKLIKRIVRGGRQALRRGRQRYFPDRETRRYRHWISPHVRLRQTIYREPVPSGLLSILTAVWDGSPTQYLNALAASIQSQNAAGACEWVVLDNGCTRSEVIDCLNGLRQRPWIRVYRSAQNLGIIRGLRLCLERASNRYVLPVDGDDQLYPDALKIVAEHVKTSGYPAILYTDEDKMGETGVSQPYFKPDWDPVLLGNLAYIAHLGVVDRKEALRLGAYSDSATEGSPDWDLFLKFAAAGHTAVHIPQVVYSWRMHSTSTAEDAHAKSYILTSQQAVLLNFLRAKNMDQQFRVENSPFFPGAPHWHFVRRHADGRPITCLLLTDRGTPTQDSTHLDLHSDPRTLISLTQTSGERDEVVCVRNNGLVVDSEHWGDEARGLFDLYPDAVMIGGRIRSSSGEIVEAGLQLGFGGLCGSPDRGRREADPGYFGQAWKQRSVGAVSLHFAVLKTAFLLDALKSLPGGASLPLLGAWLGAFALRRRKRVVYTPFIGGVISSDWEHLISAEEKELFASVNRDILPDRRYYPAPLSLGKGYVLD